MQSHVVSERAGNIVLDYAQISGQAFAIVASVYDNTVSSYSIDPQSGLQLSAQVGAQDGLNISGPNHIEMVEIESTHFAVVGAFATSSITVLRLQTNGQLNVVDQINDDRDTRFSGVPVMEVIVVDDRAYVVAGGNDDGLSLFTILPNGQILHLGTVVDSLGTRLDGPGALTLDAHNSTIFVYVAESGSGGLSAWSIDVSGDQLLEAGPGSTLLQGGPGYDVLLSGAGTDTLRGGQGDDVFILNADGGRHDIIADFELGSDRIYLPDFTGFARINDLEFVVTHEGVRIRYGVEVFDVVNAQGGPSHREDFQEDSFIFSSRSLVVSSEGNDTTTGGAGDDVLTGDMEDDQLSGEAGNDTLDGQGGTETADYTGSRGSLRVDLMFSHINTNIAAGDSYDSIENLIGSVGFDNLRGTLEANLVEGRSNVDYIFGRRGDDTLDGGIGDDVLFGREGADLLLGGLGDDYLNGGAHSDRLEGGDGDDRLRGGTHRDTFVFSKGLDVVEDFSFVHNDIIEFRVEGVPTSIANDLALFVSTYGVLEGNNFRFDFGVEGSLTLENVIDAEQIVDHILIEDFF